MGRFVASPDTAERDAESARMRAIGFRLSEIRDTLGFASEGAAHDSADRGITAKRTVNADMAKAAALARLDEMAAHARAVLHARHYTVSQGRLIYIGGELTVDDDGRTTWVGGEPLEDDAPVLNALRVLLAIEERRAKLEGTDAPVKSRVEVTRVDGIDAAVRDLVAQLGRRPEVPRP